MKNTYVPVTVQEAVNVIKTGDHIHLASVSAAPQCLIGAMCERGKNKECPIFLNLNSTINTSLSLKCF